MKLKEVYNLITGVVLVSTISNKTTVKPEREIHYGNVGLPEPPEELMESEIEEIEPFYNRTGLFKYGVVIRLK